MASGFNGGDVASRYSSSCLRTPPKQLRVSTRGRRKRSAAVGGEQADCVLPASECGRPVEMCGSRASSATLALPRRLEAAPDGKWTCGEQLDKFRGSFSAFASSWTGLSHVNKLKAAIVFHSFLFNMCAVRT